MIPKIINLMKDTNNLHHIIKMNGKQLNNCNSSRSDGLNELYNFFYQL